MIALIGSAIFNYFSWVILGLVVGFLVHRLDNHGDSVIPTLVASIIGAVAGGILTSVVYGVQLTLFNLSSFLISLTGAFLLAILVRILRRDSEEEIQNLSQSRPSGYDYAYFSDVTKPSSNQMHSVNDFFNQVDYPISKRDLLRHAEQHQASSEEINLLEKLPDHIYQSKGGIAEQMKTVS